MIVISGSRANPLKQRHTIIITQIIAIAVLAICLLIAPCINSRLTMVAYWWLPLSLVIPAFGYTNPTSTRLLGRRQSAYIISRIRGALIWFGNISFCFFLLHPLVIAVTDKIFEKLPIEVPEFLQLAVIFIAATIVAFISQQYIVTPLETGLKQLTAATCRKNK